MGVDNVYRFIKSRATDPETAITTKEIAREMSLTVTSVNKATTKLHKIRKDIQKVPGMWPYRYWAS